MRRSIQRAAIDHQLASNLGWLRDNHCLAVVDDAEYWRISVRFSAFGTEPLKQVLEQLKRTVNHALHDVIANSPHP